MLNRHVDIAKHIKIPKRWSNDTNRLPMIDRVSPADGSENAINLEENYLPF
jgi:hypothetical protein